MMLDLKQLNLRNVVKMVINLEQMMYNAYFILLYMKAFLTINAGHITNEIVNTLKFQGQRMVSLVVHDFHKKAQEECGVDKSAVGVAFEAVNHFVMGDTSTSECLRRTQDNLWKSHLNRLDEMRDSVNNVMLKHTNSIFNKLSIAAGLFVPTCSYFIYRINDIRVSYAVEREHETQRLRLLAMDDEDNVLALPPPPPQNNYDSNEEYYREYPGALVRYRMLDRI